MKKIVNDEKQGLQVKSLDSNLKYSLLSGTATVENNWGIDIAQMTLRHRISNSTAEEKTATKTWYGIPEGSSTPDDDPLEFDYDTNGRIN